MSERRPIPPTERPTTPPDHVGVLFAALLLMLSGWAGLYLLVNAQMPRVGPRWMFFVLLFMAVAGTVLPFIRYLNVRFTPYTRIVPPAGVIIRQSVWAGLFVVTCAWLQIPRELNWTRAVMLAGVLLMIETFLRLRELPHERLD